MQKLLLAVLVAIAMLLAFAVYKVDHRNTGKQVEETPTVIVVEEAPVVTPEPTMDPSVFTDVNSYLVVANKKHKLPDGYEPRDLKSVADYGGHATIAPLMREEVAKAVGDMTAAAREDGVYLTISSAYRGESYQASLYNGYVGQYGVATADTISSRPGYSDHQTGLAADFVEGGDADFNDRFEGTASGQWLAKHAYEYGFILRYPKDKDAITGYTYEPWHFRYIGKEYAKEIFDSGLSFEEYFNVEGGQEYD